MYNLRFLTPAAVEKLLKVKQHVLDEPNRLCMYTWVQEGRRQSDHLDGCSSGYNEVKLNPPCGTSACIAGWICILSGRKKFAGPCEAIECLGLDWRKENMYTSFGKLFHSASWDKDLYSRFTTTDLRLRASAAAEMIDRFIERHRLAA